MGTAYSSPTAWANTSSSVGRLGRRCRTCTPSRAARANSACAPRSSGHEHAHDVFVARVHRQARVVQRRGERDAVALDAELEHAAAGPLQLVDGPLGRHARLVQHDDVVAGELDIRQQVRRQDQVHALVVGEVADELEHLLAALRVHAVGRLVEEQQIRVVHQGLGQLDALLHARRVGLDVAVPGLAEADVVEHLVGALHRVHRRQARELAAVGHERHGVHARDVRVDLGHVAEARADLGGRRRRRRGRAPSSRPRPA